MSTSDELNKYRYRVYYDIVFPFDNLYELFRHFESSPAEEYSKRLNIKRETAFVYVGDNYSRWKCFASAKEWKNEVFKGQVVERMECGAIYEYKPSDKKVDPLMKNRKLPVRHREITIDIDMDEYDKYRTCCKGKKICKKCWKFIIVAAEMLTYVLKNNFGFSQLFYVFSGRRGCHIWVFDHEARDCTDYNRKSIYDFLNYKDKSVFEDPLHPNVQYFFKELKFFNNLGLEEIFRDILIEQKILSIDFKVITDLIYYKDLKKSLEFQFGNLIQQTLESNQIPNQNPSYHPSIQEFHENVPHNSLDTQLYDILIAELKQHEINLKKNQGKLYKRYPMWEEIVLSILAPKLDENVMIKADHLLKYPFCVHPGSKKVSVPMSLQMLHGFDPTSAPDFEELYEYLSEKQRNGMQSIDYDNAHSEYIFNNNFGAFENNFGKHDHNIKIYLNYLYEFIGSYKAYYDKYRLKTIYDENKEKNKNKGGGNVHNMEF